MIRLTRPRRADRGVRLRSKTPLPDGWTASESITFRSADGQAALIASSEPVAPDFDSKRLAEANGARMRSEFQGYIEHSFEPVSVLGGTGFQRMYEWTRDGEERLLQVQTSYVEDGRGYTVTATASPSEYRRFEIAFRRILENLELDR